MGAWRALRPFLLDGVPQPAGRVLDLTPRQVRYRRLAGEIEPVAAPEPVGEVRSDPEPAPPPPTSPAPPGPIRVSAALGEGPEPPPEPVPTSEPAPEPAPTPEPAPPRRRRARRGSR